MNDALYELEKYTFIAGYMAAYKKYAYLLYWKDQLRCMERLKEDAEFEFEQFIKNK